MYIVADENIPFAQELFSPFGTLIKLPGRAIEQKDLVDASMLFVRSITKVNKKLLSNTPVKFVGTATIGTDHIDMDFLSESGVAFASAPGCNAQSVAEYVITSILFCQSGLPRPFKELTIGVVGVGNVGSRVSCLCSKLGMRVILYDPPKKRQTNDPAYQELDVLLRESDIITFHVPMIKSGIDCTYHLCNEQILSQVKNGAMIINTSRGGVIDEHALSAFRTKIGPLVIDVWEDEPMVRDSTIKIADIATPHIAGYSFDGKVAGSIIMHEAAAHFLGRKPESSSINMYLQKIKTIETVEAQDLKDILLLAYPINRDDDVFRKIMNYTGAERASYFDSLRKNYPERLEFRHFKILGPTNLQKDLKALQFDTEV
jgi:erythronate-4-phosphate dehydrogenase